MTSIPELSVSSMCAGSVSSVVTISPFACSVQFRTTPMDSTGVPHILEHTVLCGSEKYPCRDPFFKMLNRSLSTFMNAFTGTEAPPPVSSSVCEDDLLISINCFCNSQWLHHVSFLHPKREGLPEPSLSLPGCRFLPLPARAGLLVRLCSDVQQKQTFSDSDVCPSSNVVLMQAGRLEAGEREPHGSQLPPGLQRRRL